MRRMRRQLFRYHVWLGWLVGIPLLLWTVSGLVMVARPNDIVRGSDLRAELHRFPRRRFIRRQFAARRIH